MLFLILFVKVPAVQTWLVHRVAGWLSSELGTRVEVESVSFKLFSNVVINGVYIEDKQQDTLLYIGSLQAAIQSFNLGQREINIRTVLLEEPTIGLKFYSDPREYNIDFIIDYFSGGSKKQASAPWSWKVSGLEIRNGRLLYRDLKFNDKDWGIDWEDIELNGLELKLQNLQPQLSELGFEVEDLSFIEKSGFVVNNFSSAVALASDSMHFRKLHIQSPRSEINADLAFYFSSITDFHDFIDIVRWRADFNSTRVDFRDLTYFSRELNQLNKSLELDGLFYGTVDRFKGKNVQLVYSDNTYFSGDVSMTGLPDIDETYMEINARDLSLNKEDVERIPQWPFDSTRLIVLPSEFTRLGNVHFKGRFNGFYNDFVAFGDISTDVGLISSDLQLKMGNTDKGTSYKGSIQLFALDAGKIWDLSETLGKVTMKAEVSGSGFELKNITADVKGEVAAVEILGYNYTGIKLDGRMSDKLFKGKINISDPHLQMHFDGDVNLKDQIPIYDFTAQIDKADLSDLKLLKRKNVVGLSTGIELHMAGNNIDDMEGVADIHQFNYFEGSKNIRAEAIRIESIAGKSKSLSVVSELFDLKVDGEYNFTDLPGAIRSLSAKYIPFLFEPSSQRPVQQDFSFDLNLKDINPITSVFLPELEVSKSTLIHGKINTDLNAFELGINSSWFDVDGVKVQHLDLDSKTMDGHYSFITRVGEIAFSDSIRLSGFEFSGITDRDTASVFIDFNGLDSTRSEVSCYLNASFVNNGSTSIRLQPIRLKLGGRSWMLDPANSIVADTNGIALRDVIFRNEQQEVSFSGVISSRESENLQIGFREFDVSQLNGFLLQYNVQTGGVVNGSASVSAVLGKPGISADLEIRELLWYDEELGNADILCEWDGSRNRIDVRSIITNGGKENIDISGYYENNNDGGLLDFKAVLSKTYVSTFGHHLKGIADNLSGIASGEIRLTGTPSDPELRGKIFLQKIGFTIDYLKTSYNFSTEVDILPDRFAFSNVVINDINGNQALLNGSIRHQSLRDFYFDLDIAAKKIQILKTTSSDNSIYYGDAYASGSISIKGYLDYIIMDMGLKSEPGTKIQLPLNNPEEVSRSGFITFASSADQEIKKDISAKEFSGLELNMDFEITPDAQMALIFDSKIGDVIKGRGSGNISMSISPKEDLKMQGVFTIEGGEYLFTMQNIINKNFLIEKGGQVKWSGDPYNAIVDISAVYRLRAGLYDLFQDSSFKKLVPVDLRLSLKDKLFNPTINFDIKVQNIDPNTENQVKRLINSEEERYRQAVSLLVMRRFTSPSEISGRTTASGASIVGVNAYEMLSNQLSNWASQISNQVNVGVNYRPGDAITSEELELALSTSILNDRVSIDGNVGMANNTGGANNQNTSNLVGDFNVEVKASKDGRIRLKAFNRSNNNSLINSINSPYTQGVGVFYREDFNSINELWRRYRKALFGKKEKN